MVLNSAVFIAADSQAVEGTLKFKIDRADLDWYTYVYEVPADAERVIVSSEIAMTTDEVPFQVKDGDYENPIYVDEADYTYRSTKDLEISLSNLSYADMEEKEECLDDAHLDAGWAEKDMYIVEAYGENYESLTFMIYRAESGEEPPAPPQADLTELYTLLDMVTGDHEDDWYHENDRWNGSEYSENGFWFDAQSAITAARKMTASNTQEQINDAAKALSEAIEKLIPFSDPNPTVFYEIANLYYYFHVSPGNRICEALVATNNDVDHYWISEETATQDSWAAFIDAKNEAIEILSVWETIDKDGSMVAERKIQYAIDSLDMVVSTQDAVQIGYNDYHLAVLAYDTLKNMVEVVYNPSTLNMDEYSSDSWGQYLNVYDYATEFLDNHTRPAEGIGFKGCWEVVDAYQTFIDSTVNGLTNSKSSVRYTVNVIDNYHLEKGEPLSQYVGTYTGTLPADSATIKSMMEAHGLNGLTRLMTGSSSDKPILLGIYVNGKYVYNLDGYLDDGMGVASRGYNDVRIQDGDEIVIALMRTPMGYASVISGNKPENIENLLEDIQYLSTSIEEVEAVSGEYIELQSRFQFALLSKYNGNTEPKAGVSVYISDASATKLDAQASVAKNKADVISDANGNYSIKLYSAEGSKEGWYVLNYIAEGEKGGLANGANVLVHVTDPDDISDYKEDLKSQLKEIAEAYPDDFYTAEQLAEVQRLYQEGCEGIDTATSTGSALAAYDGYSEAIKTIQQTNIDEEAINLDNIRFLLTGLPLQEDLDQNKLYNSDLFLLEALNETYNNMTDYQKDQLTNSERTLVESLLATDLGNLPDRPDINLSLVIKDANSGEILESGIDADKVPLRIDVISDFAYVRLTKNNGRYAYSYDEATGSWYAYTSPEEEGKTEITLSGHWVNTPVVLFPRIGNDPPLTNGYSLSFITCDVDSHYVDLSGKLDKDRGLAYAQVVAPRSDVIITAYVTKDSGTSEEDLTQAKETAKAALIEAYEAYDQSALTDAEKAALEKAKNDGLAAIDAAADKAAVQAAYEAAIIAMKEAVSSGTVHVVVENTTFTEDNELFDSDRYWSGTLVDKWIELDSTSTMMSLIETAITSTGHTGEGFDQGYISSIDGLGQFDGGQGSGWMGSLNGWLTNEGFSGITVSEGDIKAGDEIRVMYTCNFGQDLGGAVEGDTNTTLKELVIGNAVLTPSFDGSVTNYTLTIIDPDRPVTLTYTPANIAYQARAYLNDYDPRADFWYESGSIMPVTPGDVIYVGVGDSAWPSMGDGMGTRYTIAVATGVESVIEQIDKLPSPSKLTVDDRAEVERVKALYDALSEEDKAKVPEALKDKLEKCVERIEDLVTAKELEDRIAAMPDPEDLTYAEVAAVRALYRDYEAATEGAKSAMKVASVDKLEALMEAAERLAEQSEGLVRDIYEEVGDHIEDLAREYGLTVNESAVGGEWAVIGLERAGRDTPGRRAYLENVEAYVEANADENERLHPSKSTDNSRLIIALTALGEDVTNVAGHNLLQGLDSMEYLKKQGINGPIWALIALDCHDYDLPESADYTRYELVNYILDYQLEDGGWALDGNRSNADMTGMALQALSPYCDEYPAVKEAVDRALETLSAMQNDSGAFGGFGAAANSESTAQVIVALTALGIDPMNDERFIKNDTSAVDALCSFYAGGGVIKHTADLDAGNSANGMATEQGYYALASLFRFLEGKTSLYDMSDVEIGQTSDSVTEMLEALPDAEDVTLDDQDAIEEARDAYESLSDEEKAEIDPDLVAKLEADEEKLSELKAERAEELIDAIPENVTLADEAAIKEARAYYDKLTDEEKAMVDNSDKLAKAEEALARLKEQQGGTTPGGSTNPGVDVPAEETSYKVSDATKAVIKALQDIIDKTPADKTEFTEEETAEIVDAYNSYEALSDDEKLFVINLKDFRDKVLSKLGKDLHYDEPTGTDARDNPESTLPWNVRINVGDKALTDEEIAVIKEVLGEDANLDYIHSISFTDILTGESAEPGGLVKIKVPADSIEDGRTVVLVRQKADGSFEYIEGKVSKGVLTATLDGRGTVAVFDSSLSWDEIINGRQEAPAKSHGWLYAAGGAAALLFVILLFAKRRKKDEDDED